MRSRRSVNAAEDCPENARPLPLARFALSCKKLPQHGVVGVADGGSRQIGGAGGHGTESGLAHVSPTESVGSCDSDNGVLVVQSEGEQPRRPGTFHPRERRYHGGPTFVTPFKGASKRFEPTFG